MLCHKKSYTEQLAINNSITLTNKLPKIIKLEENLRRKFKKFSLKIFDYNFEGFLEDKEESVYT